MDAKMFILKWSSITHIFGDIVSIDTTFETNRVGVLVYLGRSHV
jgi:hypothetical protein